MGLLGDIRPTVRKRIGRVASYLLFAVVVLVLALIGNWKDIARNFFRWDVARQLWPDILRAAGNTLWYTAFSFVVGLVFAVIFALLKMGSGPFKWFAIGFIELFRGMPALLTILIMAFAIPIAFKVSFPGGSTGGGLVALILVTAAYGAEIVRAGIEAVPKGQWEAAKSLGMPYLRTVVSVILPQAIRIVIPPLTNELVTLLKDTSLLYIAGMTLAAQELTTFGKFGATMRGNSTPYFVVAGVYLIITIPLTYLVGRLEKSMAVKK